MLQGPAVCNGVTGQQQSNEVGYETILGVEEQAQVQVFIDMFRYSNADFTVNNNPQRRTTCCDSSRTVAKQVWAGRKSNLVAKSSTQPPTFSSKLTILD